MKLARLLTLSAIVLFAGSLHAQTPAAPVIEPVVGPAGSPKPKLPAGIQLIADNSKSPTELNTPETPPEATAPPAVPTTPPDVPTPPPDVPTPPPVVPTPPAAVPTGPETVPVTPAIIPTTPGTPDPSKQEMQKSEEGFILKDAPLNDIFQFLAKSAGRQYFHNTKIAGAEFLVTGHLNEGNPLAQMEELAFMYGLSLHTKGNTIYALTQAQLNQLPSAEFHYQLRYLRPTDIESIKELIKPLLSPATGIVNFERKTNTIIIIDSAHRIEQARELLHGIDKAKGQIIVETKILRINTTAAERTGINWSNSLGKDGTTLTLTRDLNSIFGLPSSEASEILNGGGTNLVLSPVEISGVLRALADGGIANQVSNPTLITEDNELATISIIDRVPIITSTQSGTGNTAIKTEEVRYKIDSADKTIDTDPDKHREIGISLVVTPTLLPDGTVRMKLRPRSAQIIEQIKSVTGNIYPRVTESMVESIARVPDGYSLVVGGFYGEAAINGKTKIPVLGDIPVLNFFFKSKEASKEKTSLVFVVTPKSYDPTNRGANNRASARVRSNTVIDCDHAWIDPENPGPSHEPNLKRSIRGLQPTEAPYYPRASEVPPNPKPAPANPTPAPSKTRFSRGGRN